MGKTNIVVEWVGERIVGEMCYVWGQTIEVLLLEGSAMFMGVVVMQNNS